MSIGPVLNFYTLCPLRFLVVLLKIEVDLLALLEEPLAYPPPTKALTLPYMAKLVISSASDDETSH